ncbi:MAG: DUF456 domain-containing protein [Treponema sp.]|jgi:uncharacterized protein YqgC (DUF456 family)|nr:DUF456 domain-containing protein [Treponema sp.]
MGIVLVILAFLLLVVGLVGSILPVLPGPPLSYIGLLLLQWSGYPHFQPAFLWIWAGITIAVTVMDYILPSLMTKQFGGSRAASIGSFLGLLVGIFFFPPLGMILMPFLGAFIGELIHNHADGAKAFKVALGAFLAFIVGSGAKLVVCFLMIYYAVKAMF